MTEEHEDKYESAIKDAFHAKAVEHVAGSVGMPVGVQVIALPFQDEMVLRVMRDLERKVQFKEIPEMGEPTADLGSTPNLENAPN